MDSLKDLTSVSQLSTIATVPTQEFSILYQPVKTEKQKLLVTCSFKREESQSPISQLGLQSEVSTAIKSELSTPLSSPVNPNSVKSEDSNCSATTSPALITELENFQDLTEWCHRARKTPNMSFSTETDELNTPVLEFEELLFPPSTIDHTNDDCFGLLNVPGQTGSPELYNVGEDIQSNKFNDLERQIFGKDTTDNFNNIKSETYQYSNVFIGGGEVQESLKSKNVTYMNNYNPNNVFTKCTDTVYSDLNQQSVPYNSKPTTNMQSSFSTGATRHENTEDILPFAPSSSFYELQTESVMNLQNFVSFPLDNVVPQTTAKKPLPRLDFSNLWVDSKQIISTPEVINTALSLDNGFNLVNFITDENIVAEEVSASSVGHAEEEDSQSHCLSTINDPDPTYTPSASDDEDEEYEPPWKKQRTPPRSTACKQKKQKTKSPVQRIDLDSEVSNTSTVESVKVVKRGRPPKRNVSISSDSNADLDVSRYRELRDKNNEASRRSRLNRKKKEIVLEEEAKDLDVRNRKLKVRVQELERLVTTMRTNLMQMLLRK